VTVVFLHCPLFSEGVFVHFRRRHSGSQHLCARNNQQQPKTEQAPEPSIKRGTSNYIGLFICAVAVHEYRTILYSCLLLPVLVHIRTVPYRTVPHKHLYRNHQFNYPIIFISLGGGDYDKDKNKNSLCVVYKYRKCVELLVRYYYNYRTVSDCIVGAEHEHEHEYEEFTFRSRHDESGAISSACHGCSNVWSSR